MNTKTDRELLEAAESVCKSLEHETESVNAMQMWRLRDAITAHLAAENVKPEPENGKAVGTAGTMPGTSGFTMACFKSDDVPVGTELFVRPPAPEGCMWSVTKGGHSICQPPRRASQTDQATREVLVIAEKVMSAMLTHMGMDEDEFNKVTFDQMRAAIAAIQALKGQQNGN